MATYKRVMVEIDSLKFFPLEARYAAGRSSNQVGRRIGESLQAKASIFVDAHDSSNIPQASIVELWKLATESKDPLHKVTLTWYQEDADKVLSAVEFMGWVSKFEFLNPSAANNKADFAGVSNLLHVEFTVSLDEANISKHRFTK